MEEQSFPNIINEPKEGKSDQGTEEKGAEMLFEDVPGENSHEEIINYLGCLDCRLKAVSSSTLLRMITHDALLQSKCLQPIHLSNYEP